MLANILIYMDQIGQGSREAMSIKIRLLRGLGFWNFNIEITIYF